MAKFTHITFEERLIISQMLNQGRSCKEIAETVGKTDRSIQREVKRGSCSYREIAERIGRAESSVFQEVKNNLYDGVYDPVLAEERAKRERGKQGKKKTLSVNAELAKRISRMILDEHKSPEQISDILADEKDEGNYVSCPTIYRAIKGGLIPNVTMDSLRSNVATVFSDGHIIIPLWVREKYNIKDGDFFLVEADAGVTLRFIKGGD